MRRKFRTWMILAVIAAANLWLTYSTGVILLSLTDPMQSLLPFSNLQRGFLITSIVVWIISFKLTPGISPSDAIAKLKGLRTNRPITVYWKLFLLGLLYWPLLFTTLKKGIKYRKHKVISVKFSESEWYTLTLRPKHFEEDENGNSISVDDYTRYFVVLDDNDKKECLIKDDSALSYLLLKYSQADILRTFGFLNGFDDDNSFLSKIGFKRCPIKEMASECLGIDYSLITNEHIIDRLHFI